MGLDGRFATLTLPRYLALYEKRVNKLMLLGDKKDSYSYISLIFRIVLRIVVFYYFFSNNKKFTIHNDSYSYN